MKLPAFAYYAPEVLDEALALRAEHAGDNVVLAGGQSLVPLLSLRMAYPGVVIDLRRITDLVGVREQNKGVVIGAMTRQREVELSAPVREHFPLLPQALSHVGHLAIRNRGTIGGSLAHADPAAELPGVVLALDGRLVARSVRGERVISARDFFRGFLTTALEPDELLVEIRLPPMAIGAKSGFAEFARRHGDFAIAGAAAVLGVDESGVIGDARLAFIGAGTRPVRADAVEDSLRGATVQAPTLRDAAEAAASGLSPTSDLHGSAEYRRHVAAVVARRALTAAGARS